MTMVPSVVRMTIAPSFRTSGAMLWAFVTLNVVKSPTNKSAILCAAKAYIKSPPKTGGLKVLKSNYFEDFACSLIWRGKPFTQSGVISA